MSAQIETVANEQPSCPYCHKQYDPSCVPGFTSPAPFCSLACAGLEIQANAMINEVFGKRDALTDLQLIEALDELTNVEAYIERILPELQKAQKARTDLRTMVELRIDEIGARKFEQNGYRGFYERQKVGSAKVTDPAGLRAELLAIDLVPNHEVDEALPIIDVEPIVKADLRKVRKLASYGTIPADRIEAYIVEAQEREILVIERIPIDVTPKSPTRLNGENS